MFLLKDKFDIIIQGGQSNAEGTGVGEVANAFIPNEKICYLYDKRQIELGETGLKTTGCSDEPFVIDIAKEKEENGLIRGDFSLSFCNKYLENGLLESERKLLVIRSSVGGTGFQKGHWGKHDYLYLRLLAMVEYALSLNPENKVVAFLWHQGEHDAFEGNSAENYHQQLTEMINGVREKFGNIPFIAGEFVHDWTSKNFEICIPILSVIRKVVAEVGNSAFVETSDLFSNNQKLGNGDDIHFCREALYDLGERYFKEYALLQGKGIKKATRLITLGDSITAGTYFNEQGCFISAPNYASLLKKFFNATILENRAISGTSYSAISKVMTEFAFSKICSDINGGDVIVVSYGTNDYGTNVELGNSLDTDDVSFYGAVDYCLRIIKENNPKAEIIVVLPFPRLNENQPNEKGYILNDYREAIRYKAEKLGLMVVDGSKLSINPSNESDKENYIFDGVHFNEDGQKKIAELIYSEYTNLKK